MRIKSRITIVYLTLTVVTVVSLFLITFFLVRASIQDQAYNQLLALVESRKTHIETYFEQNINQLKLITSRTKLRTTLAQYNELGEEAQLRGMREILLDAKQDMSHIDRICILGLNGKVLASTAENYHGRDVAMQDFFLIGKEQNAVFFVEEDGVYRLFFSGPMLFENKLIGVGMIVVNMAEFSEIVRDRTGLGETGEFLVAFYNRSGERTYPLQRLFEKEATPLALESAETALPMKEALLGREILFPLSLDYRNQQVVAVSGYVELAKLGVVAKIDATEVLQSLKRLSIFFGIAALALLILVYLISVFIAQWISRPIEKLRYAAKEIATGDLNYKISKTQGDDEIGDLARSLDQMVSELKESRKDVDQKVKEQTEQIRQKGEELEKQQKAVLNILEDIEAEKKKVELLAADLEKFKLAVDNASDHIVITDPDGIVLYANQAVTKITGFEISEVLGQKAGSKILWGGLENQALYEKLWDTIKNKKLPFIGEINNKRKNGALYVADAKINPVLNATGEVAFFVGIERDITKLKEVDKAKTEFVSLASHQLRTPLSSINWYAEMLLAGDAGKLKTEQQKFVEEIYTGNQRMVDLVNALLNVSRIELGTFAIEPEEVDLKKLAESVLEELTPLVQQNKLKVTFDYDQTLPIMILDPKLTRIIFQNLLSNAAKYTPEGGKIKLTVGKKGRNVLIEVSDTGYGIPKEQQDRIFGKLFRADNVREKDTNGTGLGLYILKSIVENSKGKVWFTSEENKGTIFSVTLPLQGMKKKVGSKALN